jgi:hypothetical protein
MNYNVDEKLFAITEIWDGLTNSQHRAMTIVLNQIVHWSKQPKVKRCELREGNIERLYKIPRKDIVIARKRLLELKLIKCVRLYSRATNQPAVYTCTTGLWQMIPKPVVNNTKAVVSQTMDNNINNIIGEEANTSTPIIKNEVLNSLNWKKINKNQ